MKSGYFDSVLAHALQLMSALHVVHGEPTPTAVIVAALISAVVATLGLVLATRLVAPVSAGACSGAVFAIALTLLAADWLRFQLEPLAPWLRAAIALAASGTIVELTRRIFDARVPRTLLALLLGAFFAGLISALLIRAMQLGTAI